MSKQSRPEGELEQMFRDQIDALKQIGELYDKGSVPMAMILSTIVSTLLRDGGRNTTSLLRSLNKKEEAKFISSSRGFYNEIIMNGNKSEHELSPAAPLIFTEMGFGGHYAYKPLCSVFPDIPWKRALDFEDWYNEAIFKAEDGVYLTRKELIASMRDQDGGAHVDNYLSQNVYVKLKTDPEPIFKEMIDKNPTLKEMISKKMIGAHYATMRQVAWEVLDSLREILPSS